MYGHTCRYFDGFVVQQLSNQYESRHEKTNVLGPKVIKHFSCAIQLSPKFIMLINDKMSSIVSNLTCT